MKEIALRVAPGPRKKEKKLLSNSDSSKSAARAASLAS